MKLVADDAMNKNVAVLTNAFKETALLKNCIQQFKPFKLYHVVICPDISWNGDLGQDDTPAMAKKWGADLVIEGPFTSEKQQFNYGLNLLRDFKYIIICDADERYKQDDIRKLVETLEVSISDVIKTANMHVYWKIREFKIIPEQNDRPVIAVKPHVKFINARSVSADTIGWVTTELFHLSYVRNDSDMWKKIITFSHSNEFDVEKWYENKWLKWNKDMLDLHPVVPEQFKQAVFNPLPHEILV